MGDFDEVERLQAGIRGWLLRSARGGRHELRGMDAPDILPLLCAAAFGPALAADPAPAAAGMGVLASVDAVVLARVLGEAATRARSVSSGPAADLTRSLEREISRSVAEVLAARDRLAGDLRSDIAMVMREIDAGGTALRAAIESGDEELEGEVLAAFEALAAEFGDLAFMLGDLARAAGEVQDSLGGQAAEDTVRWQQDGKDSARLYRGVQLAAAREAARVWAADPGRYPALTPGSGPAYAVAFSPDGAMLATASSDGSVRLWDVTTQQEIGAPMTAGSGPAYAVAFSPDGGTLATAGASDGSSGKARRWDVAFPAGLLAAACTLAGQSLTREQWAGYAGTQPFQQVCPAS